MPSLSRTVCALGILIVAASSAYAQEQEQAPDGPKTLVITFKDGHQQTFSMSEVARVEYLGQSDTVLGQDYFLGKWEVGTGSNGTFFITLESNGEASKTLGASHGIWTVDGNEARISWDDGWHDAIRKVGDTNEKFAFYPGTSFNDKANNVTAAKKLGPPTPDGTD